MANARRLDGRNCLIVGGTSGIGLASARRFLEEGAHVLVAGQDLGTTEAAHQSLASLGPVWTATADVRREAEVAALFATARDWFGGRLDVLLHTAGISGRRFGDGPLHECSAEGWDRVMQTNALGAFLTNREAVRIMRAQEPDETELRGTIVNVGSVLAGSPSPHFFGTIAYAASKGALRSLTLASAAAYAPDRIRFNLIEPGLIDTPMAARAARDDAIRRFLVTKQPMRAGPGSVQDVAEAALFLCEPASRFVTGTVLTVDGGWTVSEGQVPEGDPS